MDSPDHFEAIVSAHYEPLFRFALSLTHSESDARDLTQHTFYIWAKKGNQLRDLSKAKSWLFTTLHRAYLGMRRKETRFPHEPLEEANLPTISPEFAPRLDTAQVLAALARVDEIYQPALALFYLKERAYKDIALILQLPVGTVKSRIARGIRQLRGLLLPDAADKRVVKEVSQEVLADPLQSF